MGTNFWKRAMNTVILAILFCACKITHAILKSEDELTDHCYSFPVNDFSKKNSIKNTYGSSPKLILNVGDVAIDFTLPTPEGKYVSLGDLIAENPVVLIWGHYTCPAFQGLNSDTMFIGSSYEEEYKMIDAFKSKVTFVHMIGPEPHPIWPYANFDSGTLRMNYWSTIKQPQTFKERLALSVPKVLPYLHDDAIVLVDYLDGETGNRNNPVWCSYANAARAAILIGTDGIILEAQTW